MLVNMFKEAFLMKSKIFSIVRTLLISFLISFLLLCLMALLMWKLSITAGQIKAGLYLSYLLSCLFGGFCFGHIFPKRRIFVGLGFGICYFLVLLLLSVLFSGSGPLLLSGAPLTAGLCGLGGAAGAFFS